MKGKRKSYFKKNNIKSLCVYFFIRKVFFSFAPNYQNSVAAMTNSFKTILLLLFINVGIPLCLHSQNNTVIKSRDILVGSVIVDTIQSATQPTHKINANSQYGQSTFNNLGGGNWEITLWLNNNYIGSEDIVIEYSRVIPPSPVPRPAYIVYSITTFASIVKPADDLVVLGEEDSLSISVLVNDYSSSGSLYIRGIAHVLNGSAYVDGDNIVYTPGEDFSGDYIIYTVQDSLGTNGQGVVFVVAENFDPQDSQTFINYMSYNSKHVMIMPNSEFSYVGGHSNGRLETIGSLGYVYAPNSGYTGVQTLNFTDNDGHSITHIIHVINADTDPGVVKNDEVFTAKNTPVTFNVLDNDLTSNFPITYYSPELNRDTLGTFTYTPPTGFTGVKNFIYRVKYGNITETGKITIYIGNQEPVTSLQYSFDILQDRDFVIEYDVPISGYHFNILNEPAHGIVETFANDETITLECGTVSAGALIVYTPDNGYIGQDEFDLEYCINGSQCRVYKVKVNIHETEDDDCNCIGDCVWLGDTNADGKVSVTDLLPIGRYMGYAGIEREDNNQEMWYGLSADNWNQSQKSGKNLKHVDIDGDGLITAEDQTGLEENLGKIRGFVPNEVLSIKNVPVNLIIRTPDAEPGDWMIIDIEVGDAQYPVVDAYGMALGFVLPPGIVDSSSLSLTFYENEWFAVNSPTLQLSHQISKGNVQGAVTRTTSVPASGFGIVATLKFIIEEEADGIKDILENKTLQFPVFALDGIIEDGTGNKFKLPDAQAQFVIRKKSEQITESHKKLLLYPNPTGNILNVHLNGRNPIKELALYNTSGSMAKHISSLDAKQATIDLSDLSEGLYILRVSTPTEYYTDKIVLIKK